MESNNFDPNIQPYQFEPLVEDKRSVLKDSDSPGSSDNSDFSDDETDSFSTNARIGTTEWCLCGMCREMPTTLESLCCKEVNDIEHKAMEEMQPCICQHSGFRANCLNRDVLDVSLLEFVQVDGPIDDNEPIHELYRYIAYRRFARFIWRRLGKRNRRVLPSCVVSAIRQTYPSEHYAGFKYPRP